MPVLLSLSVAVLIGLVLAGAAYGGAAGARPAPGTLAPALCRGAAWTALGLLLINPALSVGRETGLGARPLVLLDGSLSLVAAGGRWEEARQVASSLGDVHLFGDPAVTLDSLPDAGRSLLAPALTAALASGRPVLVVTDGEIEDRTAIPEAALRAAGVRLFPRGVGAAVAVRQVRGPSRIAAGDTLRLRVELVATGLEQSRSVPVVARAGQAVLARVRAQLPADGSAAAELVVPPGRLPAGDHLLVVGLADSVDAERRDDERLHLVTVGPTPGVTVIAAPGDWEARFLYRTLRETSELPLIGFVELERGQWRRMQDLAPADEATVRRAVTQADLVVFRGAAPWREAVRGRGLLEWGVGGGVEAGDWYLSIAGPEAGGGGRGATGGGDGGVGAGPVGAALSGIVLDSLPPALGLQPLAPGPRQWTGLTAQEGRRGPVRPAVIGGEEAGGRRYVRIGAEGLWRWAFRGGAAGEAYRALLAGVVDWLLASPDTVRGVAWPVRSVVPRGLPLVFVRGPSLDPEVRVVVRLRAWEPGTPQGGAAVRSDTLRWDGDGRGILWADPGAYSYTVTVEGPARRPVEAGRGVVAVESWSEEWFPRPVTLEEAEPEDRTVARPQRARERWWLFALLVAALSGEWYLRRQRGLR